MNGSSSSRSRHNQPPHVPFQDVGSVAYWNHEEPLFPPSARLEDARRCDDLEFLVDFNNFKLLLYLLVEETLLSKGSCRVWATAHLEENSLRVQSKDFPLPMSMEGLVKDWVPIRALGYKEEECSSPLLWWGASNLTPYFLAFQALVQINLPMPTTLLAFLAY